jgi:ribonuclease T1
VRFDRKTLLSVLSLLLVVAGAWFVSGSGDDAAAPTTSASAAEMATPAGFDTITLDELPPEAIDTLVLIDTGGPYPYGADDEVFQNRERLLPDRARGYYREYTVETPGSDDRGARRIVTGEEGEMYYTDDHYDSFRWIDR